MGMSNFLYLFLFLSLLALNSLYLSYHLLFLFISIIFIFSLQSLLLCGYFRHCLPGDGYVELVEGEGDSLQVLAVLHPVDEVAAHDVRLVGEGVVRTEHLHKKYFGNIVIFKITNNPFCAAEACRRFFGWSPRRIFVSAPAIFYDKMVWQLLKNRENSK